MDYGTIIYSILCLIIISVIAPFTQFKLTEIDDTYLKRIKITKMKFLFRTIGGKDLEEHGISYVSFVLHILGYIISLISFLFSIIFYILFRERIENIDDIILMIYIVLTVIVILVNMVSYMILISVTKRRSKKDR